MVFKKSIDMSSEAVAMGKTGKKKKSKANEGDFQKKKFKVGKKLKKHTETDTTMKIGKVALTEQLKRTSVEQTTHRKLSLQDLIQQCHHPSVSTRKDAVSGLKQLLLMDHSPFVKSASAVLTASLPLLTDPDKAVRTNASGFHDALLRRLSYDNLSPYQRAISAQICCGLTHIDKSVKSATLGFLDKSVVPAAPYLLRSSADILNALCTQLPGTSTTTLGTVYSRTQQDQWLQVLAKCLEIGLCTKEDTSVNSIKMDKFMADPLFESDADTGSSVESLMDLAKRVLPFLQNFWIEIYSSASSELTETVFSDDDLLSLEKIIVCISSILMPLKHLLGLEIVLQKISSVLPKSLSKRLASAFPLSAKGTRRESDLLKLRVNLHFTEILFLAGQKEVSKCLQFLTSVVEKGNPGKICDVADFCLKYTDDLQKPMTPLWKVILSFASTNRHPKILLRLVPFVEKSCEAGFVDEKLAGRFAETLLYGLRMAVDTDFCGNDFLRIFNILKLLSLQYPAVKDAIMSDWKQFVEVFGYFSKKCSIPDQLQHSASSLFYVVDMAALTKENLKELLDGYFEPSEVRSSYKSTVFRVLCLLAAESHSRMIDESISTFCSFALSVFLGDRRRKVNVGGDRAAAGGSSLADTAPDEFSRSYAESLVKSIALIPGNPLPAIVEKAIDVLSTEISPCMCQRFLLAAGGIFDVLPPRCQRRCLLLALSSATAVDDDGLGLQFVREHFKQALRLLEVELDLPEANRAQLLPQSAMLASVVSDLAANVTDVLTVAVAKSLLRRLQ